jgi:hypothetical protein
MYVYAHLQSNVATKIHQKNSDNNQYGYLKTAQIFADFKFVDAGLKKFPDKSSWQQTMRVLDMSVFAYFFPGF